MWELPLTISTVYIDIGDYKNVCEDIWVENNSQTWNANQIICIQALLTLNSCPMFTYSERDMHRMPPPAKTHLPIKAEIHKSGIMEDDPSGRETEVSRLFADFCKGGSTHLYFLFTRLIQTWCDYQPLHFTEHLPRHILSWRDLQQRLDGTIF